MRYCKFCKTEVQRPTQGYCHNCYMYFVKYQYDTWFPSQYGELARVSKIDSKQYGWPICHECGKAFIKLQQHIWYSHKMTKIEYCDKHGLDHSINMTSLEYNEKMSRYAYKYNMPEQLKEAGKKTRFQKGHNNNYIRSSQTQNRLHNNKFYIKGAKNETK